MKNTDQYQNNYTVGQPYCHDCCDQHPDAPGFFKLVTADYKLKWGVGLCAHHAKERKLDLSKLETVKR